MPRGASWEKCRRFDLAAGVLGTAASLALLFASTAQSQTAATTLLTKTIAPQAVAPALENLSRQSGLQYVYGPEVDGNQPTKGAPAGIPAGDALVVLLSDTRLGYQYLNERTIIILPARLAQTEIEEILIVVPRFVPRPPSVAAASAAELRRLRAADAEIEQRIARRDLLYADTGLEAYLQGIARRLLATDGTDDQLVRVRVIRGTDASAFTLSNGSIYVTTALLTSLNSEAEIAGIIGHELTHYTNLHVLRSLRAGSVNVAAGMSAGILFAVMLDLAQKKSTPNTVPTQHLQLSADALRIWARAAVTGYPDAIEREADDTAVRRMLAAGYDASGALAALQHLTEQVPAEHLGIGVSPLDAPNSGLACNCRRQSVWPLYSSAPRLGSRSASFRNLLAGPLAGAVHNGHELGGEEYTAHVAALRLDQAEFLLQAGALDRADATLDVVTATGDTARAEYLRGEIARRRDPGNEANTKRALAAYSRALELPDAPVAAFREQGFLYWRQQNYASARAAFASYLSRAPVAADAPMVRWYLDQHPGDSPSPTTTAN